MDRPRTYTAEAVVLRRRNLGEADSIFTVFSLEAGKFDAIAKGVRKTRSHMRGHLEPLSRSRFLLARGRTLDVFTQAETVSSYRAVREDLDRSAEALYCAELADRLTAEHEPQPEVYWLLVELLAALDAGAPLQVTRLFETRLLAVVGYEVQVDACAACGARLQEQDHLFAAGSGGIVCPGCRAAAATGRMISPRTIRVLRFARSAEWEAFAALRIDPETARQVQVALADTIRHVLEREVNAGRFVDQVAHLPLSASLTSEPVE